jgi:uncharacterized protein (TIGR03067 family)
MKLSAWSTLGLLVVVSLVGCQSASDDAKKMVGTWTLASGEKDGEPLPEQDIKNSKLVIVGDTHTVQVGDMTLKGTHKLDSTKTPKHIDANDTEGPTKGENHGIYEFTSAGDFRVCFAPTGKDRPSEFVTKAGTGNFCHVWKRMKE